MKKLIGLFFALFIVNNLAFSQSENFYFDAVCFNGDSGKPRVDITVMTPFQILRFAQQADIYYSKYSIDVSISDSAGNIEKHETIARTIKAESYFESLGGNAKFDLVSKRIYLPKGVHQIKISLIDGASDRSYSQSKIVQLVDFSEYNLSLSGISLISSIEEKAGGGYILTPHLSDNVGLLNKSFFVFFETYSKKKDSIDYFIELFNNKDGSGAPIFSQKETAAVDSVSRAFYRIALPKSIPSDPCKLLISAVKKSDKTIYSKSEVLAQTDRIIINRSNMFGTNIDNIDSHIRFLSLVAYDEDIDNIKAGATPAEKLARFEDFWAKLDPSPGTPRNEAYEEYYSRINYANQKFKTYQEGWLTDMGRVYIIYGPPADRRQDNNGGRRTVEYWTYPNGKRFVFVDNAGFGYFEAASPISYSEKYKYAGGN